MRIDLCMRLSEESGTKVIIDGKPTAASLMHTMYRESVRNAVLL